MREEGAADFQPHVDGCFLEAIANERLVFTTVMTEGWQPAEPWLALTAILTFEAQDGGPLYPARVLHTSPEDRAKHDEMGFPEGWGPAIAQIVGVRDTKNSLPRTDGR